MTTAVMTGFSPAGLEEYGQNFLKSFHRYWPEDVKLMAFVEEPTKVPRDGERCLWDCPGILEFINRHKDDPEKCGKRPNKHWRPKHRDHGYSYRHDAVKFSRQCFIPETAASEMQDGDVLVWLDGDVVTYRPVPIGMIERMIGYDDVIYLGRRGFHCELGFWAMRVNRKTRKMVADLAELFRSDRIFGLNEWHSAFAFEYTIKRPGLDIRNLTPKGRSHVWFQSEIGHYTDHLKGFRRKKMGRSLERPS